MRVALVLAAGRSLRLAAAVPKAYLPLAGEPVLRRSVRTFLDHPAIGAVRVVVHPDDAHLYAPALAGLPAGRLLAPIHGGGTRQDSARRGLESLRELWPQAVLIHDAARPFVGADLIDRVLAALAREEAVMPGLRVTDTPKRAAGTRVQATLDRADLWLAQTPQGFAFDRVLAAHRAAAGIELSDDAAVAERAGMAVAIVPGDPDNVKITTADDLARAERSTAAGLADVRVGQGFDVHRLAAGSGVTLCGVAVPCPYRLIGHSDGDVGLHALTDAVLGAVGAGDIGVHFPPTDARWAGADSAHFLLHAAELVRARRGRISHVDVTLLCEVPRIAPHRGAMVARIAALLGLAPDRVSVKATTTERLGFLGRSEGIAAQAVATVCLPL